MVVHSAKVMASKDMFPCKILIMNIYLACNNVV